ncbi:MAG: SPOR domain-containing protein, partial [Woeseia sp.]
MRNLLLLLLLANVLYYMWGQFVASPDGAGVAMVTESKLGPKLQLADAKSIESAVENTDEAIVTRPSDIEAHFGRSCVTIGPLRESSEADGALADIEDEGLQGTVRATQGEVFVGHWVQVRGIPDRDTANEMLGKLRDGGLGEAYIVETPEEGIKISLGLFGDISGAERIELQAKSMDLPAEITNRMRDATVRSEE